MTMQEQIEILMDDGCTKSEAEKHLKNGSTVYYDLEENLDKYLADWAYLDDDLGGVKYTDSVKKWCRPENLSLIGELLKKMVKIIISNMFYNFRKGDILLWKSLVN